MNFLAGAVTILCHWSVVAGRALPVDTPVSICEDLHSCGSHIGSQLRHQASNLNMSAQGLYDTYVRYNYAQTDDVCKPPPGDFPVFNASGAKNKDQMVELYRVFAYLNASMSNITHDQMDLNANAEDLIEQLRNTTSIIRAVISNLTCLLCNHLGIKKVDVDYGELADKLFEKKRKGCRILNKYTEFISKAAKYLLNHTHKHTK